MYKRIRRRKGEDYPGIIDREDVKLSRLLLVSERDWRKLPAEAGAEAAEKLARRNLNFLRRRCPQTLKDLCDKT